MGATEQQPVEALSDDPRVDSLRTRLAELDSEAAFVTAGVFSLAQEARVLQSTGSSQLAAAYHAMTTAVDRLISIASINLTAVDAASTTGRAPLVLATAQEALHG